MESWEKSLEDGKPFELTFPLRGKDGTFRWFLTRALPLKNSNGKITHWFGTNTDIDAQVENSLELERKTAELESLYSYSPLGLAVLDRDHRYLTINQALADINGVPLEQHFGEKIENVLPETSKNITHFVEEVFRDPRAIETEIIGETPKEPGVQRHWLSGFYPVFIKGKVDSVGAYILEITDLRKTEEALKEALRARDEFLSIASHELKTPLTSLKIQFQLIDRQAKKGNEEIYQKNRVDASNEKALKLVSRLDRLIDDMLDISRIRTGKLTVTKERVDLSALVKEVVDRMQGPFIAATGEKVLFQEKENCFCFVDPMRIEQVLSNLLQNALRYGKKKKVEVTISCTATSVDIAVKDQGIGIPKETQEKIFDRFERAVNASEISGLGLGLYISQQIAKAHGGKIWVESEVGKGSIFHVELPFSVESVDANVL